MLRETLTTALSINKVYAPTWMYKFCAACLSVLVQPWTLFDAFRQKEWLVASCMCQVGQLTNVLNYLYDNVQNRIYITQAVATPQFLMQFAYPPEGYASDFGSAPLLFLEPFGGVLETVVTINVPASADVVDLTAIVAQIMLEGIVYKIVTF